MTGPKEKALRLLDAAFHDLALDVVDSNELTKAELSRCGVKLDDAVARVTVNARASLAKARRTRLDQAREARLASRVSGAVDRFTEWTREAIVEKIEQLQLEFPGQLQVEHRDLEERPTGRDCEPRPVNSFARDPGGVCFTHPAW